MNGYITPPPGLLPSAPPVEAPRRDDVPIVPSFPGFAPTGPTLPSRPPVPEPGAPFAPAAAAPEPAAETQAVQVVAPASVAERPWSLRLPDGSMTPLAGAAFVGRNPQSTDAAPGGAVLPLNDPAKSLSKTHALLVPSGDWVMVTDLHSTNGTAVIDRSGSTTVLEPGRSSPVADGSVLQLGSFAVTLVRAAQA
ncbi:MAG: FHA domain-containing protein [Microbacteriaceae bacterium]|nr:FHA domain-containing protein [Microbacteriaceae bacterium]